MHARDFKTAAQKSLKNNWGIAIGAMVINSVIISAISYLANGTPAQYWWISTLCGMFIAVPITVGYSWFHLDLFRHSKANISTMFEGFSNNYTRNVATGTLMSIFVALWSLLFIIPGIIKGLAYSMTFFILRDRPELSALDAITESRKMMEGKKKELFYLMLSFLGWVIIPYVLTALGVYFTGVGIAGSGIVSLTVLGTVFLIAGSISSVLINLYVTPYYMTSVAAFYEKYAKLPKEESYSHAG